MDTPSDFKSAVEGTAARNGELILRYRESARDLRNPAVRRLLQSVLDRKSSQSDILRTIAASGETDPGIAVPLEEHAARAASAPTPGEDPAAALLRGIQAEEDRLAVRFDRLRDASRDEENRQLLHSLSETSRKIGLWARDHLELLSLF